MSIRKPNFFILGAPKCGTTSLAKYLGEHPNIFIPQIKEPQFFSSDYADQITKTLDEYLGYYRDVDVHHLAIGDASTAYLRSQVAVTEILKFNPDSRFIVMLRNPVDMVCSLHSHRLYECIENEPDFEKAWRLQNIRQGGKSIPSFCKEPKSLLYGSMCRLGEQLERLYRTVPRDRVLVILFDDFVADTKRVYEQALQFLDVASDRRTDFPRFNPNKVFRSHRLRRLAVALDQVKHAIGLDRRLGIMRLFTAINAEQRPRPALAESFVCELRSYFEEDIMLLSRRLDRDLSPWLEGRRLPPAKNPTAEESSP